VRVLVGEKEVEKFDTKERKWKKTVVPNYLRFEQNNAKEIWAALHLLTYKKRMKIGFKNIEEFRKWLRSVGVNTKI